jgi:molybdopterin-containing oxidoreductase family iron-sulfur binding subunit
MDVKKEQTNQESSGISRRGFLKILGQSSVVGAVGCGKSSAQKIFPYVKADEDQVKGVAVWYNTTCTECDAGCGIQARTREGRTVKIEGNPLSPINRGGVCAIGHSALQNTYDPDRIRQPLSAKLGEAGNFTPTTWDDAITKFAERLGRKGKRVFLGHPRSGALAGLINDFCGGLKTEFVAYNPTNTSAEQKAAELVYGTSGVPTYSLEKADVIMNFGADFLETWMSPCEYARGWSEARRKDHPVRVIHVEPRLSLTGASADTWLMANPGTEARLALAVLKLLVERGKGSNLGADVVSRIKSITNDISVEKVSAETGIGQDKILVAANYLFDAKASVVLAGGSAATTATPLPLLVAANFLNLVLGNVGSTVNVAATRNASTTDISAVKKLIEEMNNGDIDTLIVDGTNPLFNLPSSLGFEYGLKKVPMIVSLSSQIDETTYLAQLVLPTNTGLESWGDSEPKTGVFALSQPTMKPVFDTRSLGDILIQTARRFGNKEIAKGHEDFLGALKEHWAGIHAKHGAGKTFDAFWQESLANGGYFAAKISSDAASVKPKDAAFGIKFTASKFGDDKTASDEKLVLMPYPSVRSFDGRSANRPWLLEVPDPMSQISWDAWVEMHPDTAKKHNIDKDDVVTVRNHYGELNLGVVLSPYIHPGVVAVPIGHGHTQYGRFAQGNGGNVMQLIPPTLTEGVGSVALMSALVSVRRGRGKLELVKTQGSDSQLGRELARVSYIGGADAAHGEEHGEGHGSGHGAEHHEAKQMYVQRPHPHHKWGMAVDLAACTGCSACVVACYAENNIPVVGRKTVAQGREMSWLKIDRYFDHEAEELHVSFMPMMCQHCNNAPCEPVCPVYATYHNEEGMNVMVYNRCVGTRYCSNNCSYKVRRFNWLEVDWPEPLTWQLNPDVTPRGVGVMEKCTFCIQRIQEGKDSAKDLGREVLDGEIKPACVQSCPTQALTFGDLNDPESAVSKLAKSSRAYKVLDHHLNTQPSISYLNDVKYKEV